MTKKEITNREFDKWMEELLSAVTLVGGSAHPEWGKKTIEDVFKTLYPNGVYLCFRINPDKMHNRIFGPESEYLYEEEE